MELSSTQLQKIVNEEETGALYDRGCEAVGLAYGGCNQTLILCGD